MYFLCDMSFDCLNNVRENVCSAPLGGAVFGLNSDVPNVVLSTGGAGASQL